MSRAHGDGSRKIDAPFPWFGGKSRVAADVWNAFGDVPNYVEPFFGSGAVLLGRPHAPRVETVNDLDGYVANFWRAVKSDPRTVADWATWPANETDLHARHMWLVREGVGLSDRLLTDPDYFDAKIAGWWCWGICSWIGGEWCSGKGPWKSVDGKMVKSESESAEGIEVQLPKSMRGGVQRRIVSLFPPRGVLRKMGSERTAVIIDWFVALGARLEMVRVCSGDWSRNTGKYNGSKERIWFSPHCLT